MIQLRVFNTYCALICIASSMLSVGEMQQVGQFPPLKDRIFHSTQSKPVIGAACTSTPSKYKAWSEDNLCLAYQSYEFSL